MDIFWVIIKERIHPHRVFFILKTQKNLPWTISLCWFTFRYFYFIIYNCYPPSVHIQTMELDTRLLYTWCIPPDACTTSPYLDVHPGPQQMTHLLQDLLLQRVPGHCALHVQNKREAKPGGGETGFTTTSLLLTQVPLVGISVQQRDLRERWLHTDELTARCVFTSGYSSYSMSAK